MSTDKPPIDAPSVRPTTDAEVKSLRHNLLGTHVTNVELLADCSDDCLSPDRLDVGFGHTRTWVTIVALILEFYALQKILCAMQRHGFLTVYYFRTEFVISAKFQLDSFFPWPET
ncbi:hypothetical protein Trydic_g11277 [Trypoxylus dichotomus]